MNLAAAKLTMPPDRIEALSWHGDNAKFVVETLLPRIPGVRPRTRQVIRWAYGYDGAGQSFEKLSNGSSVVSDMFMGGLIKEPYGVAHDWLFYLHANKLKDPSGHKWSLHAANNWYFWAMVDFGYPKLAVGRRIGLAFGSWAYWR